MSDHDARDLATSFPSAAALRQQWLAWAGTFPEFMAEQDRRQTPYLSYSKVATVERCSRCYLNQYVLGRQPTSTALTTGLLFHEAAATFYNARRTGAGGTSASLISSPSPRHLEADQQPLLDNAMATLRQEVWEGHEVVAVEELFFMQVADDLPAVIGIVDLILKSADGYVAVDHKTGKRFGDPDPGQLELYAEHVRRTYGCTDCEGAFDEYRLVPNLARVRTPVFQRTFVKIAPGQWPKLVDRYRRAWAVMARIHRDRQGWPSADCWFCKAW